MTRARVTRNRARYSSRGRKEKTWQQGEQQPPRFVQAIKASGVIVRVEAGEFSKLMKRANDPLIVLGEGGLFSKNYQYLMSYKGIAFFTKSSDPLPLPSGAELVRAAKIWVPGG